MSAISLPSRTDAAGSSRVQSGRSRTRLRAVPPIARLNSAISIGSILIPVPQVLASVSPRTTAAQATLVAPQDTEHDGRVACAIPAVAA
jgi:hypothetical protein